MKTIRFVCLLLLISLGTGAKAQLGDLVNKAKSVAAVAGYDVNKLSGEMMTKLSSGLNLTALQSPKVAQAISFFLANKSTILPLLKTNPAEYKTKAAGLFSDLKSKLGGMLLKDQMNKFLGMKPATNDPANVLSKLFY